MDVANPLTLLISGTEGHIVVFRDELYFVSSKLKGADGKKHWVVGAGRVTSRGAAAAGDRGVCESVLTHDDRSFRQEHATK